MATFELHRYQILPLDRFFQGDLLSGITSIDELLTKKNDIFSEALIQVSSFDTPKTETITKKLYSKGNFFLYRIAANRSIHRETKDFTDEYLDNWPSILVAIWNDPDQQLIAVQKRTTAFQKTSSVVSAILNTISGTLEHHQLRSFSEPMFERKAFWDLVKKHEGKIDRIDFEFITPNMANISSSLSSDLKSFAKSTNSVRNSLSITADPQSSLNVSQENEAINGLVDYSADGGGNVAIKIANIKKKHHTSKTAKEIEVSDVAISGAAEETVSVLKELFR